MNYFQIIENIINSLILKNIMAQIREIKGSIFDSDCDAIVNTVNCKGFMGKGLALEFKYRFPEMFNKYSEQCAIGEIKIGELTLWDKTSPKIINFPTKNDWKFPSRIEYLEKGLEFFSKHYELWGIKSVAFPRLGSHNGGLKWAAVKEVMFKHLGDLNLIIEIYEFNPINQDKLYSSLISKLNNLNIEEYSELIGLKLKEAKILKDKIDSNSINSLSEIKKLPGFGEKSLQKVYSFANTKQQSVQRKLV